MKTKNLPRMTRSGLLSFYKDNHLSETTTSEWSLEWSSYTRLTVTLGISKSGCGIKMQIWLLVVNESQLEFGNRVRMRMTRTDILREKREYYIWLQIKKLGRQWRRLNHVMIVVSCLELPKKGWREKRCCLGQLSSR